MPEIKFEAGAKSSIEDPIKTVQSMHETMKRVDSIMPPGLDMMFVKKLNRLVVRDELKEVLQEMKDFVEVRLDDYENS